MAYKVLDAALTTSTEALYMFVADNEEDIPNLPNMEQRGNETNTRWYAKAGSVVRVVATGRFYTLAPPTSGKPSTICGRSWKMPSTTTSRS